MLSSVFQKKMREGVKGDWWRTPVKNLKKSKCHKKFCEGALLLLSYASKYSERPEPIGSKLPPPGSASRPGWALRSSSCAAAALHEQTRRVRHSHPSQLSPLRQSCPCHPRPLLPSPTSAPHSRE